MTLGATAPGARTIGTSPTPNVVEGTVTLPDGRPLRGATIRVAGGLRFFLPPRHRQGEVVVPVDGTSTLLHVVESLGVPRTEFGTLRVDGRPALDVQASEQVTAAGGALWIYYPEGIAASKLTPGLIDRAAGSPGTARNFRTVLKLREMLVS